MVGRGEITAAAWATVEPLLPEHGRRGRQWRDHRQVLSGILWKLRTGAPKRDLPNRSGPWRTVYARFVGWQRDGTWDRLLSHVQTKSDAVGEVVCEVHIDHSIVRAPQHAADARNKGAGRPRTTCSGAAAAARAGFRPGGMGG
jgi:transposase